MNKKQINLWALLCIPKGQKQKKLLLEKLKRRVEILT